MKIVSGEFFWTKEGIPFKYEYLDKNLICDVVVIGGGVTGALCTYYLSQLGADVVLVEKNIIGYNSTRASTSILQYEIDSNLIGLSGMIGEEKAGFAFRTCKNAVDEISVIVNNLEDDCEFIKRKCILYTDKRNNINLLAREFELRKKYDFNVEFLDENNSKNYFSFPIKAGIISKDGAAELNPYKFTQYLVRKALKNGAKIFENTNIVKFEFNEGEVNLTTNNGFKIKAKKVIIASGYEGRKFIRRCKVKLTRTFTLVTKPVNGFEGWHERCIIRDDEEYYTYLRTTKDNRIIIGGLDTPIGSENSLMSNLDNNDLYAIHSYNKLYDKLKNMFPKIDGLEAEYKFSGIFGTTSDGLPYIGEAEAFPNCYFCLGYGSNGILYGVIGAKIIKNKYLGNTTQEEQLFKFNRN